MYNKFNLHASTRQGDFSLNSPAPTKKIKPKREKSTSTKGHYVKNSDLLPAVIEAKELGVVTTKLITMIQLIAERYSRKSWFIGYSYREDMISAAVENLCKNALKFDHTRYSNPFAFYTTAIRNSFLQYMAEEKKHRNIRDKLLIEAGANPSFNFTDGANGEDFYEPADSDTLPDIDGEIPEDDAEVAAVEPVAGIPVIPKEAKYRYKDRIPGPVVKMKPGDIEFDPVAGCFVLKKLATSEKTTATKRAAKTPKVTNPAVSVKSVPVKVARSTVKKVTAGETATKKAK